MGLAAVFGIVEQAHGAIVVESETGSGSTMSIYWPLIPSSGPDAARTHVAMTPGMSMRAIAPPKSELSASGETAVRASDSNGVILVVDDEDSVRRVVTRLLERDGYHVLAVASGTDAIAMAEQEGTSIRALLSDVRMPGLSGVEMVANLLAKGIDLPVLFMSGQLDAPLPTDWPRTVPRHFIGKPFTSDALSQAMRDLLATSAP